MDTTTLVLSILSSVLGIALVVMQMPWFRLWLARQKPAVRIAIEAAAAAAVQIQNRDYVNADRANPDSGEGVGHVSPTVAAIAKKNAVEQVGSAVVQALSIANPSAGAALAKLAPAIEAAIEQAVEAAKPKLPQASVNLFPDGGKSVTGVLLLFAMALALQGCVSVPRGWKDSNADQLKSVSISLEQNVYGPNASTEQPVPTLATAGRAGASVYNAETAKGVDKQERILHGCQEELRSAKTGAIGITNWDTLAASIRSVSKELANDADQCLGLLLAALCAPAKTSRLMLRYDQPESYLSLCAWPQTLPVLRQ